MPLVKMVVVYKGVHGVLEQSSKKFVVENKVPGVENCKEWIRLAPAPSGLLTG